FYLLFSLKHTYACDLPVREKALYSILFRVHCRHWNITNFIFKTGRMGSLFLTAFIPYTHHFFTGIPSVYCLLYGHEILV
ncbi:hypothetical protein I8I22_002399, partial [Enterobacter cloacae]